jgi:DNA adenine methylase
MTKTAHKRTHKFHYSPLRYPGGKTFLFPLFDNIIKANALKNVTYIEPYAGGAGAALALLFLEKVEKIIINDYDRAIYSFWQSAVNNADKFIEKIKTIRVTVSEWKRQKSIYMDRDHADMFDLGFATFFLNRTNISGILDGGPIGGLRQKGKWKINARYNKIALINKIQQLALYKNRISVFNRDGVDLIKEYLGKKDVFIYLDPPYYEKGASLYLNHYKENDHAKLAEELNNSHDAIWLLTYDNKEEIKTLYQKRRSECFTLTYNAYESREGKEIMIFSDALAA